MLTLYTDSSPNGFKATIALEELGLPYTPQARPHQPGRTPPARLPAPEPAWPHPRPHRRRDRHHPVRIRRHPALPGRENWPPAARRTARPLASTQWLIFHAASVGPLIGQRVHFEIRRPQRPHRHRTLPPPHARSLRNAGPALASGQPHFAGDEYSIADIAHFGWTHIARLIGFDFDAYPHLSDWHERIASDPPCSAASCSRSPPSGHE